MISGIYKWTSPSGKSYIGQAINLKKRCREFRKVNCYYTSKGSAIDNARAKYNNFNSWKYEVLEECDIEQLDEKEIYYINKFDTYNNGYNSTIGGDGTKGHKLSDDNKQKLMQGQMEARERGAYDDWYNSEELKELTSNKFKGRVWAEEQKQRISNSLKGNKLTYETKKKLSTIAKARFESGWTNEGQEKAVSKEVEQYDLEENYLQTYPSMIQAAKAIGKSDAKSIRKVCNGEKESVYGFIWKFK